MSEELRHGGQPQQKKSFHLSPNKKKRDTKPIHSAILMLLIAFILISALISIINLSTGTLQPADSFLERQTSNHSESFVEKENLQPPPGFPWHRWDNDKHKSKLHRNLLDAFDKTSPNTYLRYVIRNGTLYCPKNDIADVQATRRKRKGWHTRISPIERTINEAIQLGQSPKMLKNPRVQTAMSLPILDSSSNLSSFGLPLLFDRSDSNTCGPQEYPVFKFSRVQDKLSCNSSWTFPEYNMIDYIKKTNRIDEDSWKKDFSRWRRHYPWEKKLQKAVWRGGATGHVKLYPNWLQLPRVRVSFLSKKRPDILDAGFTKITKTYNVENFTDYELMKPSMESEDFMKYRAIIDVDGNSWSSRLSSILAMNSVVIKVEPIWSQYFFDELQPWVHYVPSNFSNLVETLEYVLSDDNALKMQEIVKNAQTWAKTKVTRRQVALDMLWIIVAYVETLHASSSGSDWQKAWVIRFKEDKNSLNLKPVPHLFDSHAD